jgi:hypothetical protein
METWYRISGTTGEIRPVEVMRHTAKYLFLPPKGRRESIGTGAFQNYFPTLTEAVARSRRIHLRALERAMNDRSAALAGLGELKRLYPDEYRAVGGKE